MTKPSLSVRNMTIAAVVAALYAALTLLFAPISFPVVLPQSIPGLALGCLLANLLGSATPWDVIFGTLTTLLAALLTRHWRRNVWLAACAPVVCNAVVVGLVLALTLGNLFLLPTIASVGLGEAVVVYALGVPMLLTLSRVPLLRKAGGLADAPESLRDSGNENGSGGGDEGKQA